MRLLGLLLLGSLFVACGGSQSGTGVGNDAGRTDGAAGVAEGDAGDDAVTTGGGKRGGAPPVSNPGVGIGDAGSNVGADALPAILARDAASTADVAADRVAVDKPLANDVAPDGPAPNSCGAGGLCEALEKQYLSAVQQAKACISGKSTCGQTVPDTLVCMACAVWVENVTEPQAIQKRWSDAGCAKCPRVCPAILRLCLRLTQGICSTAGICEERGLLTTN
jgi:hypothetical protein